MVELLRLIVKAFFALFYRVEIVGLENVPSKGSVIVCSNHIGELDMFVLGYRLPRLIHWMAKEELLKIPVMGSFFRALGTFPVRRGAGDIGAIRTVLKLLSEGKMVGIFPEGHRMRGKRNASVKAGAVLIAEKSGAPILPVAISGNYKLFSKIRVVYGSPFKLNIGEGEKLSGEEMAKMSSDIMDKVYSLMEVG